MRNTLIAAMAALAILMSACNVDPGMNFESKDEISTPVTEVELRANGVITLSDDIVLLADTGSPSETINSLRLIDSNNNIVESFAGCYATSCSYDLSMVQAGTYTATVSTSNGIPFSSTVIIP